MMEICEVFDIMLKFERVPCNQVFQQGILNFKNVGNVLGMIYDINAQLFLTNSLRHLDSCLVPFVFGQHLSFSQVHSDEHIEVFVYMHID